MSTNLWGSSGAIHFFIFYHCPTRWSDGLNIYLALVSAALLRVGNWVGFSYHKFIPSFWSSWNLPISGIFCFTRCTVKHLGLSEKSWGLLSVIEGFTSTLCVSHVLQRSLQRFLRTCLKFLRKPSLRFCPNPLGILVSCLWVFHILQPCCYFVGLVGFSFLVSLCQRKSKILRGTDMCLQAMYWEVASLPSCFAVLLRRRSWQALFPDIWLDLFRICILS